jgi:hypothetical protein
LLSSEASGLSWSRDIPNSLPNETTFPSFLLSYLTIYSESPQVIFQGPQMSSNCRILINQIFLTSLKAFTQELNPPFELELVILFPSNLYLFIRRHLLKNCKTEQRMGSASLAMLESLFAICQGKDFRISSNLAGWVRMVHLTLI